MQPPCEEGFSYLFVAPNFFSYASQITF